MLALPGAGPNHFKGRVQSPGLAPFEPAVVAGLLRWETRRQVLPLFIMLAYPKNGLENPAGRYRWTPAFRFPDAVVEKYGHLSPLLV